MKILDRLYCLYLGDTGPTKFWSIWVAVFASAGMALKSNQTGSDIHLMLTLAPWWVWSLILLHVVTARTVSLLWWTGVVATRIFTPLISVFLWGFFFASQFVAPNFGLGLLFLVPALQETWILSRVFYDEKLL